MVWAKAFLPSASFTLMLARRAWKSPKLLQLLHSHHFFSWPAL